MKFRCALGLEKAVFFHHLDKADHVQPHPVHVAMSKQSELGHLRILCVDNEPDILVGMENLLSRWGCDIRVAIDLVESLQALEDGWIPDVIFSDYRLDDGRTGLEVLQQCRLRLGTALKASSSVQIVPMICLMASKQMGSALLLSQLSRLSCVRCSIESLRIGVFEKSL